ncbi:hypothetical protein A7A08_02087 [Methyloligella halotolerans]|uniref:Uncharacterized protein n=1 Tax=Methyloligella halotolerans TaxID=1177755 RepID=A0A1E2RXD0_9HYPH|nr:hypothetical protein [Methyloligella halotolerans]ODA66790.1 hypothetical protein A7A08_02087 [Methyloligella halotolerans]
MPDYGEILAFLAANPPCLEAERELHASLLELLAQCLRSEQAVSDEPPESFGMADTDADEDAPSEIFEAFASRHSRTGKVH